MKGIIPKTHTSTFQLVKNNCMGFRNRMRKNESQSKKRAVYLNSAEALVLSERIGELKRLGCKAGQATVLRALMHITSAEEMFVRSVKLFAADALAEPSTGRTSGARPTIEVTDDEWSKVGDTVERMARNGMTATHNLVLRALVVGAPVGRSLLGLVEAFRVQVPNKPRGLSAQRQTGRKT